MARWVLLTAAFGTWIVSTDASARTRQAHPVIQNIGGLCGWRKQCMALQQRSMQSALSFVASSRRLPMWRVHLCNRNASRASNKIDWVGFDACIRNKKLKRPKRR